MWDSRNEKVRVASTSLLASILITTINAVSWILSGSLAILAEVMHALLDVLVTAITLVAVSVGSRPPDKEHPYGHGKAESIGAFLGSLLIVVTGLLVGYESAEKLISGLPFKPDPVVMVILIVAVLIDFNRYRILSKAAVRLRSRALEADSLHFKSDLAIASSVILMITFGLLMDNVNPVLFNKVAPIMDSAVAIAIVGYFMLISFNLMRIAIDELMDRLQEDLAENVARAVSAVPGVMSVRNIRARMVGSSPHVELTIGIPDHLSITEAHRIADDVEDAVRTSVGASMVMVHVEPELHGRIKSVISSIRDPRLVEVHDIRVLNGDKSVVTMHALVRDNITLSDAEELVSKIRNAVRSVEPNAEVKVHLEPSAHRISEGEVRSIAEHIVNKYGGSVREVRVDYSGGFALLLVDIELPGEMSIHSAHDVATEVERGLSELCGVHTHIVVSVSPKSP